MTPTLLSRAGEALHGPNWPRALARDLRVAERTIYRWRDGSAPIPPGIRAELRELAIARGAELARLADELSS